MAAVSAAKRQLRTELRRALAALSDHQIQEESAILIRKFLKTEEYQSSNRVAVYLSMPTEVNAHPILEDAFKSGKECFIPRFEGSAMDMLKVHSMEDIASLPRTKWNIQQPATAEGRENPLTSSNGLDLILVPGLGFTEGYYDGYLAKCIAAGHRPKTLSMAFSCQKCEHIPTTDHDFVVDRVIFPDTT